MGIYNVIKDFKIQCPNCHEWVEQFQTRDFMEMEESSVDEVNNFYSGCPNCGAWIEFTRKLPVLGPMLPEEYVHQYFKVEVTRNQFPTQEL